MLSWFERLLTPRLEWVTGQRAERFIGIVAIVLALVSTLPIPFGHNLPALGLVLIGLGLIERDGLAILIGAAIGLIGSILLGLVIFGVAHGLSFIIHAHGIHLLRRTGESVCFRPSFRTAPSSAPWNRTNSRYSRRSAGRRRCASAPG